MNIGVRVMITIELVDNTSSYQVRQQLQLLMYKYFNEMEGGCIGSCSDGLETMLKANRHIYVCYKDKEMVGFMVYYVNDQYGMTPPTAVNEYMYIEPNHRSSLVSKAILKHTCHYCNELSMDIYGTTYLTSSNINNIDRLGGTPVATVYKIPLEILQTKLRKINEKIERVIKKRM